MADLDAFLALTAGKPGVQHELSLADSIVYVTAQLVGGVVWTLDAEFEGLPDVQLPNPALLDPAQNERLIRL